MPTTPQAAQVDHPTPAPTTSPAPAPALEDKAPVVTDINALGPIAVPPSSAYALIGRYDDSDPGRPRFAYPGSRFGVAFTGTQLVLRMSDTGYDAWSITIDGVLQQKSLQTTPSSSAVLYHVASNLPQGNHTVWLSKRTEANQQALSNGQAVGSTQFHGIALDKGASLLPPPSVPTRKIEFLGDSAFTGYGALVHVVKGGPDCGFSPQTQNADASVPQYTADYLNAQGVNLSGSGQAVFNSFYDQNHTANLLPVTYNQIFPTSPTPAWDFSRWTADVVVINAGGDDLWGNYGVGQFPNAEGFISTYTTWLANIRSHYPQALIVCSLSPAAAGGDINTLGAAIQNAIARRNAAGDANIQFFNFYAGTSYTTYDDIGTGLGLAYGCNFHASPEGAQWLAKRLADFIASKKSW